MSLLVDTNVLLRLINGSDPLYPITRNALAKARKAGHTIHVTSQNFIEFRHVATRPAAANGLGWTGSQASSVSTSLEAQFDYLPDSPAIFTHWKALVDATGTTGRPVHDARLAAVAVAYGISSILTFNVSDFARFAPYGISAVDPASL